MFLLYLLVLITLGAAVSQIVAFSRLKRYVETELEKPSPDYKPKLAVILPCKGLDPDFKNNVLKLLDQDYLKEGKAHFEVIFAVATQDDLAYPILKEVADNASKVNARVVIAGTNPIRAQKVNNQLFALQHVSEDVEALVFVDSDVIARSDFLAYLVSGLKHEDTGATTGYRFYVPFSHSPAALLRSMWNRMSAWELINPRLSFAWGGAMAIRREVFEGAKVARHWERSADDDLALTTAVKQLGLKVRFIPQCLVASHGDTDFADFFEWMNRQLILTKVYYPQLWRKAIIRAALGGAWLIALGVALVKGFGMGDPQALWASILALCLIPTEIGMLIAAQGLWETVLDSYAKELRTSLVSKILSIPLAHIILPWMTLYSLSTNRIQWRGVTYELRSPSETVIV